MRTWQITEAFVEFKRRTEEAGFSDITSQVQSESSGNRNIVTTNGDAGLRLAWDDKDKVLSVKISHGPPEGEMAGWLDLFKVSCLNGTFLETENQDTDFISSVEYGLELITPST